MATTAVRRQWWKFGEKCPGTGAWAPAPSTKRPGPGWQHLKAIKNRGQKEASAFFEKKVVLGQEEAVLALLGKGTVYLERCHLTMGNFNARIARKGLGVSKNLQMHTLAATWEDVYYNLCHEVRTLKIPLGDPDEMKATPKFKQKWKHRTPMMAAQITDHTWTVKELLYTLSIVDTPQLFNG